jgi:S1-C subfamily serine protease
MVSRSGLSLMGLTIVIALLVACGAKATALPTAIPTATAVPTAVPTETPSGPAALGVWTDEEQTLIALYEQVSPSVVFIAVQTDAGIASGSGFIIDTDGHIVTNNHVVEGASEVLVEFYDNSGTDAQVVGADPYSDLAVIQVSVLPPGATPVTLGDSDAVRVGQTAIAIGNPFGREFAQTMTTGIISAKARSLPAGDTTGLGQNYQNPEILQTDAAINPGNSGGPLFDNGGEVIGINAAIESQSGTSSGVGFAIPVNTVKRVVPELIQSGQYAHPYIGISAESVTMVSQPDNPDLLVEGGTRVVQVVLGGPAAEGGLLEGDLITAIDSTTVHDFNDLVIYLETSTHPGDVIELTVLRDNVEQTLSVQLGERP